MSYLKKLAGQSAVYGLSTIVGRFINYLLVPFYTRVFIHPEDYGVITGMYAYISFLTILYTYGMETAFFRFSNNKEYPAENVFKTSFLTVFGSSALLSLILFLFQNEIAAFMGYPGHGDYIAWFAGVLFLDAVTAIPYVKLRQQNRARKFASLKLLFIILNVSLNIFFLVICPRYQHIAFFKWLYNPSLDVGYVFISNLLATGITSLFFIPDVLRTGGRYSLDLLRSMLWYALPLLPAGLAGMVNETMDRILLIWLIPDKHVALYQTGVYGAVYKLSILLTLFIQTFRFAAEPFFFSHADKENAKEMYATVMNYFVWVCVFIFLLVAINLDFIKYFIGNRGSAYHEGLKVVPILLLANLCLGIFTNLSIWYKLSGHTKYGMYLTIIGAVITILLNILWIPVYGYVGSAWATLICYFIIMVLSYLWGQRFYPVPYHLKRLLTYIFGGLILYLCSVYLLRMPNAVLQLIVNAAVLFIFAGLGFYLERIKNIVPSST